jgi:hypothetical protein
MSRLDQRGHNGLGARVELNRDAFAAPDTQCAKRAGGGADLPSYFLVRPVAVAVVRRNGVRRLIRSENRQFMQKG